MLFRRSSRQGEFGLLHFPAVLEEPANLLTSEVVMNCVRGHAARSNPGPANRAWQKLIGAGLTLVLVFAVLTLRLAAQQSPQPADSQPPAPAKPSQAPQQPPGTGSQLQTGTASGLNADARLMNLLADHQYFRVQAQLGKLPPDQAQFYRGILANRSNDLKTSIDLLAPLLDQVTASGDVAHEKLLRFALAEDYLRLGDLGKAARAYKALDDRLHASLTADEQNEIEMPLKMTPLAKDNPPVTADPCEPFRLQVSNDPLGLIDVPVFIDARSRSWMLDPTVPFNLIARSTAREIGLQISNEAATISTLTGRPIQVHSTVIPRMTIGGRLTLHNVTAFVYDDADYYFPHTGYQVEGVLGYPALAVMGSLTVTDNAIEVRPAREFVPLADNDHLKTGSRFFLDGDRIIVALGKESDPAPEASSHDAPSGGNGSDALDERMFAIDAGSQQTYLTSRWFDENAAQFNGQKTVMFSFPGEGFPAQAAYVAETVPLAIGSTTVNLHYISVLTQPLGSAAHDDVYGLIGIDALDQLKSYTFDYRSMRFSARGD
jgi:Aspartyl protease